MELGDAQREILNPTWTFQVSESKSLCRKSAGSPLIGARFEGLIRFSRRSISSSSSSCNLVAFLQRCSKLVKTSYAACPSILQCQSCHGSLGPPLSGKCWMETKQNKINYIKNVSKFLSDDPQKPRVSRPYPRTILALHPLLEGYETQNNVRWLPSPNHGRRRFHHNIGAHMNILIIVKVKIFIDIKWSYSPPPPIMLTNEPRMVNIFWARNPIFLQHMSLWCPFLHPHLSTRH